MGGGGGGVGEVYKKTIRIEPNMMLVLPIKISSCVQSQLVTTIGPSAQKMK